MKASSFAEGYGGQVALPLAAPTISGLDAALTCVRDGVYPCLINARPQFICGSGQTQSPLQQGDGMGSGGFVLAAEHAREFVDPPLVFKLSQG